MDNPWVWYATDYMERRINVSIPWDETTRDLLDGIVIHRDPECRWTRIVWDVPDNPQKARRSPAVPEGDTTITAQQMRQATGFRTIDDLLAVQITAEP